MTSIHTITELFSFLLTVEQAARGQDEQVDNGA